MGNMSQDEIDKIAKQVTESVLKAIAPALRGMGPGGGSHYNCIGIFDCAEEYTCHKPDSCEDVFSCGKKYTPAKEKEQSDATSKDCNYVRYTCQKSFSCDDQYQCGYQFTCAHKFTG